MKLYNEVKRISDLSLSKKLYDEMLALLAYSKRNYSVPLSKLAQKRIVGVGQPNLTDISGQAVPGVITFSDGSTKTIYIRNGSLGDIGDKGKTGLRGDKGDSAQINNLISDKFLTIVNDGVTDDSTKVWSALQGVEMAKAIALLSETFLTDYQYSLLFDDSAMVYIEAEFDTDEPNEEVILINEDVASHKRYIKYWTFESEGAAEYFVINYKCNCEFDEDGNCIKHDDDITYNSVFADLWNDIYLGGSEGYFAATAEQLVDGTQLYVYNKNAGNYNPIEQFDENNEESDLERGERRFVYYLPNSNQPVKVDYKSNKYDYNLLADELELEIYVFDHAEGEGDDRKLFYNKVKRSEVDPDSMTTYYTLTKDGEYEIISNVNEFIKKKSVRYYKRKTNDSTAWFEVESLSDSEKETLDEYMIVDYAEASNTNVFTYYKKVVTIRGEYYEIKIDTLTPYSISYYVLYDEHHPRKYFTRKMISYEDPTTGNIIFDYEYTEIKLPFWLEAEFLTETEDERVLVLNADTHYDSDEEIIEPVYIEKIIFEENDITIAKGYNKNVNITILPENVNTFDFVIDYDESMIKFFEDGRIGAIESAEPTLSTILKVYSKHDETVSDSILVNIITPVAEILTDEDTINVYPGSTATLQYWVSPDDSSKPTIKWSISDSDMVLIENYQDTFNNIGTLTVTPKLQSDKTYKTGTCILTGTSIDGFEASVKLNVLVAIPVTKITITTTTTQYVDKEFRLTANIDPSNVTKGQLEWTSSDPSIIQILDSTVGSAKPLAEGECEITATSTDGSNISATVKFTVERSIDKLTIENFDKEMEVGMFNTIKVIATPADATILKNNKDKALSLNISDKSVIECTEITPIENTDNEFEFTITAISGGSTQISVLSNDGYKAISSVDLDINVPLEDLSLGDTLIYMYKGDEKMLTPIVNSIPGTAADYEWSSSDESIATVSNLGRINALAPGRTIISIITKDNNAIIASCTLIVKLHVDSVVINNGEDTDIEMYLGDYLFIPAKVTPDDATDQILLWTSSDSDCVTVENNGTIFGKSIGEASITATSVDNVSSNTIKVIVKEKNSGTKE